MDIWEALGQPGARAARNQAGITIVQRSAWQWEALDAHEYSIAAGNNLSQVAHLLKFGAWVCDLQNGWEPVYERVR